MSWKSVTQRGHPVVFGLIILFAIIEMCITAFVTANYNSHHNYPNDSTRDRVRYILFMSIWTLVVGTAYLVGFLVARNHFIFNRLSHFIFLIITWILWLAAAAAFTSSLGGALNCNTQTFFVYCGQLNAIQGFAWVIWIVVTLTVLFILIQGIVSHRRGDDVAGPLVD